MKAHDRYKSMTEFEVILEDARMEASNDWEEEFVEKAKENYAKYGLAMFWSEAQDKTLRRIAGPDDW